MYRRFAFVGYQNCMRIGEERGKTDCISTTSVDGLVSVDAVQKQVKK